MGADVGAEHLDDEPDDGVGDGVEGELLAGAAARVVAEEHRVDDEEQGGFEELARVDGQGRGGGRGDEPLLELLGPGVGADGVDDAEGAVGAGAEAAAFEEAADATGGMPDGEGCDDEVDEVEVVLVVDEGEDGDGGPGREEAAVKHEPALVEVQNLPGMAGEFGVPVLDDVGHARTAEARDDERREQVRHIVAIAVRPFAEMAQGPEEEEESNGHADAVPVDFKST